MKFEFVNKISATLFVVLLSVGSVAAAEVNSGANTSEMDDDVVKAAAGSNEQAAVALDPEDQAQLDAAIASGDEALVASVIAGIVANSPAAAIAILDSVSAKAPKLASAAVKAVTRALPSNSPVLAQVLSKAAPAAGVPAAAPVAPAAVPAAFPANLAPRVTAPALTGDAPSTGARVNQVPVENPRQTSTN